MKAAPSLDRLVQFRRSTLMDDGFSQVEQWADYGSPTPAAKADISDGERWRAASVEASITTRFTVRWTGFTVDLTPKDQLVCDGITYNITGVKEVGPRRRWLEITATTMSDLES